MSLTLRPPLTKDEFDGEANLSNGGNTNPAKGLYARLVALDNAAVFLGSFATSALPSALADWQALSFDAVPTQPGLQAWNTTTGKLVVWDGTSAWLTQVATGLTAATTTVGAKLDLNEGTNNGTNKVTLAAPASLAADRVLALPSAGDLDLEQVRLNAVAPAIVSVGAANATTVAVAIKVVDGNGADKAAATPFRWWLSSSATTGAIHGTTPDGGTAITGGSKIGDLVADKAGTGVTATAGTATVTLIHAANAQNYYLWVECGGRTVVSTVIANT